MNASSMFSKCNVDENGRIIKKNGFFTSCSLSNNRLSTSTSATSQNKPKANQSHLEVKRGGDKWGLKSSAGLDGSGQKINLLCSVTVWLGFSGGC